MFQYQFNSAHHIVVIQTSDNGAVTNVFARKLVDGSPVDPNDEYTIDIVAGTLVDIAEENRPILMMVCPFQEGNTGFFGTGKVLGGTWEEYIKEFDLWRTWDPSEGKG